MPRTRRRTLAECPAHSNLPVAAAQPSGISADLHAAQQGIVDVNNAHILHSTKIKELVDIVKARKLAYYGETKELPGERDKARNNARCMQASKTMHSLNGQHQDIDRSPDGRERTEINGESSSMSDRGWLKNKTELLSISNAQALDGIYFLYGTL